MLLASVAVAAVACGDSTTASSDERPPPGELVRSSKRRVVEAAPAEDTKQLTHDFSGMDGTRSLFVQDVVHEAFVAVDEKGTEAAAATAVIVGRTSAPERVTLDVTRPFVVVIRDRPTGAILFVGQIVRP
jgi:serine protease inhibitor